MLFNSIGWLLFFPVTVIVYTVLPQKLSRLWLTAASVLFCFCGGILSGTAVILAAVLGYLCGRKAEPENSSFFTAFGVILCSGGLLAFKFLSGSGIPLGMSYYSLRIIDYLISVRKGKIPAEKSFLRFLLYITFFPIFIQGPIERAEAFLPQLERNEKADFSAVKSGLLLILWGFALKLIAADRIALFVNTVYGDISGHSGFQLMAAALLYSLQLYCDFMGYTCIAMGSSEALGFRISDNFTAPFFAESFTELWRRWHVSLSFWLRDHIYYPLGGSRKGKTRKYLNIMAVFLVSALWHGKGLGFLIWGLLNGLIQVLEGILSGIGKNSSAKPEKRLSSGCPSRFFRVLRSVRVYLLFSFVFLFFRLPSPADAFAALGRMLALSSPDIPVPFFGNGISAAGFLLLAVFLIPLFLTDLCKVRGIRIREKILCRSSAVQILVIAFSVTLLLVFGIYGPGYDSGSFIYAGF